jgi:alpha-1,2-mannosyltransferase
MKPKVLILSLLAILTLAIDYLAETRNGYFDSKVYYGAIQYWFHGDGGMVYDWLRPGTPYGFTYPPFAGLVMSPMALLPFGAVVVIAVVATVLTTVAALARTRISQNGRYAIGTMTIPANGG